jgi:phage-related minor tail protein
VNGEPWAGNYFNYFTEIEEHFQRARGSSLFLMSPLDWALVESWKNTGVPLEAVLRGIDDAFEKYRSSKRRNFQQVNSLAYCAQAIAKAAADMLNNRPAKPAASAEDSVPSHGLRNALEQRAAQLTAKGFSDAAASVNAILVNLEEHHANLEDLEMRLCAIEEKILAQARASQSEQQLLDARRALESELKPHRGRLSAAEIAMLEKSFLDRELFARLGLDRLSLFFLL